MVFGALSVFLYRPWRRRIDARRQALQPNDLNSSPPLLADAPDLTDGESAKGTVTDNRAAGSVREEELSAAGQPRI